MIPAAAQFAVVSTRCVFYSTNDGREHGELVFGWGATVYG